MSKNDPFEGVARKASEDLEKDRLPLIGKESTQGKVTVPRIWNLYAPEIWEEIRQREEEAARKRREEIRAGRGTLHETWQMFTLPVRDAWADFVDWITDTLKAIMLLFIHLRDK